MPIRIRKSIKLAPGLRANFSNSGISTSAGTGGFRLTSPKGGCLSIIAWPFIAIIWLYYWIFKLLWMAVKALWQVATATPQSRKVSAIAVGALAIIGLFGSVVNAVTGGGTPPVPTIDVTAVQQTANAAAWLPYTQTAAALPTVTHTAPLPSPTFTLVVLPTQPLPTETFPIPPTAIPPTQPPVAACQCAGDAYNCDDFASHSQAQACYAYCVSVGVGDIHQLDRDGNGLACESL